MRKVKCRKFNGKPEVTELSSRFRLNEPRKHLMRVKLFKGTRSSASTVTVLGVRCSQGSGD